MPLRSVEAASRDDAIAAAREQFGPQARVVGVRRVRSGGVLGFFATERYVAEVAEAAPESAVRPAVPARGRDDDASPADFSSPPASAAPARARAAAPARNGAAAWADAARSTDDVPEAVRVAAAAARAARTNAAARSATPAPAGRTAAPAWTGPQTAAVPARPADDDRVSELVGLLAVQQSESAAPTYSRAAFPRASFPRTQTVASPADAFPDEEELPVRGGGQQVIPAAAPATPSPFTAALARMVAGDQDVRQAVQDALSPLSGERPRDDAEPWPVRSEPVRPAETSVPPVARQEEETVGDQVIAPPSTTERPVEVPTWAATPEVTAASVSPREEAIADLLRGALAQGHSDEALAGILRKVLAGASPQSALTEPAAPVEPVFAVPPLPAPRVVAPVADSPVLDLPMLDVPVLVQATVAEPALSVAAVASAAAARVAEIPAVQAPVVEAPVVEAPAFEAPAIEAPVADAVVVQTPMTAVPVTEAPVVEVPSVPAAAPGTHVSAGSMRGLAASTSLWGDVVPAATTGTSTDAPIWAEVARQEPTAGALFPSSAAEPTEPIAAGPTEPIAAEAGEPVEEGAAVQQLEESLDDRLEEAEVAELAPLLARTASDPAPMMSFDATTVMPPLSLLPPLPSSRGRGRGRPPVPPAAPRTGPSPSIPAPSAPSAPSAASTESTDATTSDDEAAPTRTPVAETVLDRPVTRSLATVTRLPVAPLMVGPEVSELVEDHDEVETPDLFAPLTAPPATAPVETVLALPCPDDVADRLQLMGLPAGLLGGTFDADVADLGTYAALTRSLARHLPTAPELPRGAGEAVFVVGPGAEALRAARSLAATLHLDPDCVQWATRGDLAGLAPRASQITSVDAAIDRRQDSLGAGTVTIVAVDAPLRTDAYWMAQLASVWAPVAVWAVVEATRKPEDLEQWIDGLPRVDALIVQDVDLSADPAAVLRRLDAPVALLDGVRATPHRWASLLCERLESTTA